MNLRTNNAFVVSFKIVVLVLLLGSLVAISQSSLFASYDLIRTALAIDFLFTVPVLYFFLIKRTSIPPITVIPVFLASFALASLLLPDGVGIMRVAGWVLVPAVEFVVFGYLVFRIYRMRKTYLDEAGQGLDLMERLRNGFVRELKPPFVARSAAFEVAIFAYVLFKWRRPREAGFSCHRTNGSTPVLAVFLFLLVTETVGLHFLLSMWSPTLALVVTAFSIYFIVQIVAHLKALRLRPIVVTDSSLLLRCGILGDAVIPREAVESAEMVGGADDTKGIALLPLGGMSQPNVRVTLTEQVTIYGLYGFESRASVVRVYVDDPSAFIDAIGP